MSVNRGRRSYNNSGSENIKGDSKEIEKQPKKHSKGGKRLYRDSGAAPKAVEKSYDRQVQPNNKKKGGKKALIAICVVLAVIVFLAIVGFVVFKTVVKAPVIPNKTRTEIEAEIGRAHV